MMGTRMRTLLLATSALLLSAMTTPTELRAQADTTLSYEREVFTYRTAGRGNPFKPLVASDTGGPRFEQLRLTGVIYSEAPGQSVAIMRTNQAFQTAEGRRSAWYLRVGQSLGNVRIIEIQREQVVLEVEEFGLTEQRIMQLASPSGGNP